jgi:hypothetical protein
MGLVATWDQGYIPPRGAVLKKIDKFNARLFQKLACACKIGPQGPPLSVKASGRKEMGFCELMRNSGRIFSNVLALAVPVKPHLFTNLKELFHSFEAQVSTNPLKAVVRSSI